MIEIGGKTLPLYGWIILALILFTQGSWLFFDARKRGANAWFWGIIGLIQCPCPLIFYLAIVRKALRKRK